MLFPNLFFPDSVFISVFYVDFTWIGNTHVIMRSKTSDAFHQPFLLEKKHWLSVQECCVLHLQKCIGTVPKSSTYRATRSHWIKVMPMRAWTWIYLLQRQWNFTVWLIHSVPQIRNSSCNRTVQSILWISSCVSMPHNLSQNNIQDWG